MTSKKVYLKVKDHTVSGEEFSLLYNEELDMLQTSPMPSLEILPDYYKSDDYISHTDSKRNLFERIYHFAKKLSLKRKLNLINSFPLSEKTLLDIGCGTGDFLKKAQENNWIVSGIEPNKKARFIANTKIGNHIFDVDHLVSFKSHSFNVITLWHVIEHLPNLQEHITILKRLLKKDGVLIIAVPNYKSFDAKYYKNFWAAYDVPRHLWHFSQLAIEKLFSKVNMSVQKKISMKLDAFYVSLLSEKYKLGWMNIFRAFIIASYSNIKAWRTNESSSITYIIKNS